MPWPGAISGRVCLDLRFQRGESIKAGEAAGGWSRRLRERGPVFNHKQEAETGYVVWKWGKAVNPQNLSPMKCLFQQDYV